MNIDQLLTIVSTRSMGTRALDDYLSLENITLTDEERAMVEDIAASLTSGEGWPGYHHFLSKHQVLLDECKEAVARALEEAGVTTS